MCLQGVKDILAVIWFLNSCRSWLSTSLWGRVRGENHLFSAWTSGCGCYCFWGLIPQLWSRSLCVNAVTSVKSLGICYWAC